MRIYIGGLVLVVGAASRAGGNGTTTTTTTNTTTATAMMVPLEYTVTVYNSDCPCQRHHLRYCTWFRRSRVRDGRCYAISHHAQSTRVEDALVSARNRLVCRVYTGLACDGVGVELVFTDSTRCREPGSLGGAGPGYRSFSCTHVGS